VPIHFVLPPNLYVEPPGEGDFSVSNFHPDPIPGNLDENIFGVREVAGRERGGLFWATSLGKIIGGMTALMQQSPAVPRCAILSLGTGGIRQ
jgi:hypothetical protein